VNGQVKYHGSTSETSHKAEDVFAWLGFMAPPKPGSVMGFGTIPDCTGLDHDGFIDPGSGTDQQRWPAPALTLRHFGYTFCGIPIDGSPDPSGH
jgi:2-keto-4-pentenoate hydratase/2-oxohepta-3-ene-1,7-dioic acid hydratase in catechol pathway